MIGLAGADIHHLFPCQMVFADAIDDSGICITRLLNDKDGGALARVGLPAGEKMIYLLPCVELYEGCIGDPGRLRVGCLRNAGSAEC
jgi:hypothetical protein